MVRRCPLEVGLPKAESAARNRLTSFSALCSSSLNCCTTRDMFIMNSPSAEDNTRVNEPRQSSPVPLAPFVRRCGHAYQSCRIDLVLRCPTQLRRRVAGRCPDLIRWRGSGRSSPQSYPCDSACAKKGTASFSQEDNHAPAGGGRKIVVHLPKSKTSSKEDSMPVVCRAP